jgi:1-acyl-sn-glycerol-3-phosphate acyltransferase
MLRIFFRHIEVVGSERLPEGGLLLAPNHPNGLVDPLFVFCLSPRPVSFLAKAPLFETPIVKTFIAALDALPVYRAQDGYDTSRNRETLDASRRILDRGGAIAIFPEGKSHDEPGLEPLKTGPARIALGARAGGGHVSIIPCGIFYTLKETFRSDAVLVFGDAIKVPLSELDEAGEPPFEVARELTAQLRDGLEELLVQGQSHDLLTLAARAARVVRGAQGELERGPNAGDIGPLEEQRQLRRLLLHGYASLVDRHRDQIESLSARIEVLDGLFAHYGLDPARPGAPERKVSLVRALLNLVAMVAAAPFAVVGIVAHWFPYRGIDVLARRMAKGEGSVLSTMKILGGLLLFPLWWTISALAALFTLGPVWAGTTALVLPLLAYLALWWLEGASSWKSWVRSVGLRIEHADTHRYMLEERRAIYRELLVLSEQLDDESGELA